MAKISYNIKANIREASKNIQELIKQANQLRAAMQRVSQIGERTPLNTNLLNALTKAERQIESLNKALDFTKKQFADVGSLKGSLSSIATDNIAKSTNAILRDAEKLEQRLNRIEERSKKAREDIRQAESKSSNSDMGMSFSGGGYSRSKQLELLRKQAEEVYNAYYKTDPAKYRTEMNSLRAGYDRIRAELKEINSVADESFNTVGKIRNALSSVHNRFMFLASRGAALFALDLLADGARNIANIEQGMAGFEQVMAKGEHTTNMFGKSLVDAHPEKFTQGLQEATNEAGLYQKQLEEMQDKLLTLAVRYGSTSEDVIESAKLWGRAYKDNNVVLALTDAATKLAIADAFDIVTANKALESSIMQWGFEIKDTNDAMSVSNRIVDSWTALSHNYTVSANTLVEANRRMAQSAKVVGVGFHEAQALISVMARKTMADGGEIGNALKSIFGSIHSEKAIKALQDFGVEVYQIGENGEKSFRRVDAVLTDLMIKSQSTNRNMEDLLKSISGGKWQWNKAGAMLDLKEYIHALTISTTAYGFTNAQVGMQLDTISRKMQSIRTQIDKLMSNSGNANKIIKDLMDVVLGLLKLLEKIPVSLVEGLTALATIRLVWRTTARSMASDTGILHKAIVSMQSAVKDYVATVNKAPTAMGKFSAGLRGLIMGIGPVNVAFMGIQTGLMAVDYALHKEQNTLSETIDTHNQLIQVYEEQRDRLAEAKPTLETLISTYNQLTQAQANDVEGSESWKKIEEEKQELRQGMINIVGDEADAIIDGSEISQEEQAKMMKATDDRISNLDANIATEKQLYADAAGKLRDMVESDIQMLNNEKASWWDLITVIATYGSVWDIAKASFLSLETMVRKGGAWIQEVGIKQKEREIAYKKEHGYDYSEEEKQLEAAKAHYEKSQQALKNVYIDWDNLKAKATVSAYQSIQDTIGKMKPISPPNTSNSERNSGTVDGGHTESGGGSGGSRSSSKPRASRRATTADIVYEELMKAGMSSNYAAGIVGNLMEESGGNTFDIVSDIKNNIGAYGIAQWLDSRRTDLETFASTNGLDVRELGTQIKFLIYELTQGKESGNWRDLQQQAGANATPEMVAHLFNALIERSGVDSWQRQVNTRNFLNYRQENGNAVEYDAEKLMSEEAKRLKAMYDKLTQRLEFVSKISTDKYNKAMAEIDVQTKLTGDSIETFTKKILVQDDYTKTIIDTLQGYKEALEKSKKEFTDDDQKFLKDSMKKSLDDFYNQSSLEMQKDLLNISKEDNKVISEKLNLVIELKKLWESVLESQKASQLKAMELRKQGFEYTFNKKLSEKQFDYDMWQYDNYGKYIAPWNEPKLRQPYLDDIAKLNENRVKTMQEVNSKSDIPIFSQDELRQATKQWKEAEKAAKEYAVTLKNDVKQQTYDVFHSLIIEGNSIKDVWKKLWQGLAEDALKALLRINDGQMSLFGRLITGLFGGSGGGSASATPHADGGLVESEQLYRIGERGKKEMVVPLERNNPRGKMLVRESARRLGMLETKVEPSFKSPQVQSGTVIKQLVSKQNTNMARMEALTQTMVNILTFMANNQANGAVGGNNVVQPVVVKQTMSDIEFMQHFQKMQRMGKLK